MVEDFTSWTTFEEPFQHRFIVTESTSSNSQLNNSAGCSHTIQTSSSTTEERYICNRYVYSSEPFIYDPRQHRDPTLTYQIVEEGCWTPPQGGFIPADTTMFDTVNVVNINITRPWRIRIEGFRDISIIAHDREEAIEEAIKQVTGDRYGFIDFQEIGREREEAEKERVDEDKFNKFLNEAEGYYKEIKLGLAEEKALKLLMENLTKVQLKRFLEDECIPIDSKLGNKYLIRKGRQINIEVLGKDGTVKHKICAHPVEMLPDYDTMLAQKLFLESAEEEFLKLAVKHNR